MFCKNCGNQIPENAAVCMKCGFSVKDGNSYCANCGNQITPGAAVCVNCGVAVKKNIKGLLNSPKSGASKSGASKSKIAAGLLGIFLGGWGIHNFYLGYTTKAVIQIVVSIVTCGIGAIWGFVEGIMILAGAIDVDADGVPLE